MKKKISSIVLIFCLLLTPILVTAAEKSSDLRDIGFMLVELTQTKLKDMPSLLEELSTTGGSEVLPLFNNLLIGNVYYRKDDLSLLVVKKGEDRSLYAKALFSGKDLGIQKKSTIKKIRINNKIRTKLRKLIALENINSENSNIRLSAVKSMLGKVDEKSIVYLDDRLEKESDKDVQQALKEAVALYKLENTKSASEKLISISILKDSLESKVKATLDELVKKDLDGNYLESNTEVRMAAANAIQDIEGKIKFYNFLEQLFFGLSLGSVLLLAAIGLSITFGVMGVINMAHGEMIMLGAYTTYVIQLLMPNEIAYSLWVAIPAAFLVSGFVGICIERGVIRFLKGRPLETLLATFGISLILQQLVRSIFSPLNRQVVSPEWMSGSLEINALLSITYNRLYILIFSLLVFFALQLVLKKTSLGLNVRAVSQNRDMAKSIGIKTERVDALTFGLGSGIAGIAGVALSQLTNVGPNLGQSYIVDSFMVVVFGGVGNLLGTLVGGFSLGIASKFLEPATGAVMANIIILVFIILFIQRRPQGLFPQKGRAAND